MSRGSAAADKVNRTSVSYAPFTGSTKFKSGSQSPVDSAFHTVCQVAPLLVLTAISAASPALRRCSRADRLNPVVTLAEATLKTISAGVPACVGQSPRGATAWALTD